MKRKYTALEFRLLKLLDEAFPYIGHEPFSFEQDWVDKTSHDVYEILVEHGL